MSEDFEAPKDDLDKELPEGSEGHSDYKPADSHNESVKHQLTGMYPVSYTHLTLPTILLV